MRQPLLVHLILHPKSPGEPGTARDLAVRLHEALNDDPAVPGLRVPTVFAADDGTDLPPECYDLDEADRSVVVVLADDAMVVEPAGPLPEGRQTWGEFAGDLRQRCQRSAHRFIPIAVSEHAWPLDPRLDSVSFLRAHTQAADRRAAWTTRAVVVELCRFLDGLGRGERVPLRLFLSHAKQDIASDPPVFKEIVKHLEQTQPVKTWIDSADVDGGSKFSEEIEKGVLDSVLLVIATRNYSSRPWCRKELLLAEAASAAVRHRRCPRRAGSAKLPLRGQCARAALARRVRRAGD